VATQLTRKSWRTALSSSGFSLGVDTRYAVVACAVVIALAYASVFAAMRTSRSDRDAAEARYLDTVQLLSVPPVPEATLEADLVLAQTALSAAEQQANTVSIDVSSDEATAAIVRRVQDGGLAVVSIARMDPALSKLNGAAYDVRSLRMTVRGTSLELIVRFLQGLHETDPRLMPTLTSLVLEADTATAEIVFSAHTKVEPTPAAGATGAAP
jgi:hypothetical protein